MILWKLLAKVAPFRRPLLVLAAVVVVFLTPPTACLLKLQSYVETGDAEKEPIPALWRGGDQTVPGSASEAVYIASHTCEQTSGQSYWDMIRRYPREPALYAGVLRYYIGSDKSPLSDRSMESRNQDERRRLSHAPDVRLRKSEALSKALDAVSVGRKLEPENVYYDLCQAYLLYGEGRDAEALAVVRRASAKRSYDSHLQDWANASLSYGIHPMFPLDRLCPFWKAYIVNLADYSHMICIRSVCRLAMRSQRRDEPQRLIDTASDVIRLGGLVRDCSDSLFECYTSVSLQRMALDSSCRILRGLPPQTRTIAQASDGAKRRQSKSIRQCLADLQAAAGDRLPESTRQQWEREAARSDRVRANMAEYVHAELPIVQWIAKPTVVTMVSSKLLLALLWLGFFWFGAWVWLAARRKLDTRGLGPSPLRLWFLILIPALPIRYTYLSSKLFPMAVGLPVALALGIGITAVPAVLLSALLRTRVLRDVGRLDTFLVRLRRGCAVASVGVLIAYVASIALNVAVAKQVSAEIDRVYTCEARLIRDWPSR